MQLPDTSSLDFFAKEWPVIKAAPLSFAACVLIAALIIWAIVWWINKELSDRDQRTIGHLERENQRLEKQLESIEGGNPSASKDSPVKRGVAPAFLEDDPHFKAVRNTKFENQTVELDGKRFEDCEFTNVTLIFRGDSPMEIIDCQFFGNLNIATTDPAIGYFAKVAEMLKAHPKLLEVSCVLVDEQGHEKERLSTLTKVKTSAQQRKSAATLYLDRIEAFQAFSLISVGKQLAFRLSLKNPGPMVVTHPRIVVVGSIASVGAEHMLVNQLRQAAHDQLRNPPALRAPDVGPALSTFSDFTFFPMSAEQASGLLDGSMRLYFYLYSEWKGADGLDGNTKMCFWLPTPSAKKLTGEMTKHWNILALPEATQL